jgi:ABC-type Fe3+ transport system substrate-binding protein
MTLPVIIAAVNRPSKLVLALLPALLLCAVSCRKSSSLPADSRTAGADQACREKWGKGLDQMDTETLVILSAHSENVLDEFEWAFSLHYAMEHGRKVAFDRRSAGGGGNSNQGYLLNVYGTKDSSGKPGKPGVDILWGGGDAPFVEMARGLPDTGPLLEKLSLDNDVLANIPARYTGTALYDPELRWVGSALSGFGILYNKGMLSRCGIAPPTGWRDLGDARFAGLLELADPAQSSSAAAAYRAVVVSAPTWPEGWARLMLILGNAKKISDSANSAVNAPVLGEALVATCVDFYGILRAVEAPDQVQYFTPSQQAVFTPDPIAVLRDAPNPALAREFVRFVLSPQGQALWALDVGKPGGPVRRTLGRQPIRRDVYHLQAGNMLPYIVDPYAQGKELSIPPEMQQVNFAVLKELVGQAAVANQDGLFKARQAVARHPELMAEFVRLPQNVATLKGMNAVAKDLKDKARLDVLRHDWRDFFEKKYRDISDTRGGGQ